MFPGGRQAHVPATTILTYPPLCIQTILLIVGSVREVRSASFALCIVLLVNVPQIVAAVVILAKHWTDQTCGCVSVWALRACCSGLVVGTCERAEDTKRPRFASLIKL